MEKNSRTYGFVIEIADATGKVETIEINGVYQLGFMITRNNRPSANIASFDLYNIDPEIQETILNARYNHEQWQKITFDAGYGDEMLTIFEGCISEAKIVYEKQDVITRITAYSGAYAMVNSFISGKDGEYDLGETLANLIKYLAVHLDNTPDVPVVGKFDDLLGRKKTSLFGNVWDLLVELTGGRCFIDNNRFFALKENEAIQGPHEDEINDEMEILGKGLKAVDDQIEISMLLEPRITVGQAVRVEIEDFGPYAEENCIVTEIEHIGTVGATNEWLTKLSLRKDIKAFEIVR